VIIRQGDEADRFYLIEDGRFEVTRAAGDASEHLRTMGPGEVFGEIGLLRGVPRTATVTAAADGRLLALEGADFVELVGAGSVLRPRLLDLRRGAPGAGY
jgi:CRP-like cAMP-binding protein